MKTPIMDVEQKRLLKKFHTLLGLAGIDNEGKLLLLAQYGVESSKDLSPYDLLEVCNKLQLQSDPQLAALDKARKRLIASICGWRESMGVTPSVIEAKKIACHAASVKDFNQITQERLRSLYSAFGKKTKDLKTVSEMTNENIKRIITLN